MGQPSRSRHTIGEAISPHLLSRGVFGERATCHSFHGLSGGLTLTRKKEIRAVRFYGVFAHRLDPSIAASAGRPAFVSGGKIHSSAPPTCTASRRSP